MKFMMNGALTIGTRDGATVEMAEEAGEENMFLFGLTAKQVEEARGSYNSHWHYEHDPETRRALDLIASGHFNPGEPGIFDAILDVLLAKGDFYLHLADLRSYSEAHNRLGQFYLNPEAWTRAAILNVAASGKFSSDRTIAQYAAEIWNVTPCPVIEIVETASLKAAEGVA
jgi:starch phosphorylase